MKMKPALTLILGWAVLGLGCSPSSETGTESSEATQAMVARVEAAIAAPGRPVEDREIDVNRKPAGILAFMEIEAGMSVLDVSAAGGYYTELLAAAVGPAGTVYAQNMQVNLQRNDGAIETALTARLASGRLLNVERVDRGLEELGMDGQLDAAFAILTVHDWYNFRGEETAHGLLIDIHAALRSGGTLAFIDHAGDAGQDNRALHRFEQDIAERLITEAGFVIEARSDLLATSADDHTVNVFDPSIRRRTDRFVIRARKP